MGSRAEVFRLLEEVVRQGIAHFDTARSYGRGYSEKLLGEFFRAHGAAFAVTTKFGASYAKTDACPTAIALPLNWAVKRLRAAVGGGLGLGLGLGGVRECESPRVSGQPTPRDADLRMGGGRFEGANVNVNGFLGDRR